MSGPEDSSSLVSGSESLASWFAGFLKPPRRRVLANGLEVILAPRDETPMVAVNLWYRVGSKDDPPHRRGLAHLVEHLMFTGSQHYPSDFVGPLQRLGARVNASTAPDRTNYVVDLPPDHLDVALAMEADRMANLVPALTPEKLAVQQGVIRNEAHQDYTNKPYGRVWSLLAETLFPPGHPYSWTPIGVIEEVEAVELNECVGFLRRHYTPANACLCVAGAFDPDRAWERIEHWFEAIDGGARWDRPAPAPPRLEADRWIRLHDRVEVDRLYEMWPSCAMDDPDDPTLELLAETLCGGRGSRLHRALVIESELATEVSCSQWGRLLAGSFAVVVGLRPGRSAQAVREILERELRAVACHGVTPEELNAAHLRKRVAAITALERVGGFGGLADQLNAAQVFRGDPLAWLSPLEAMATRTPQDLAAAAQRWLADRPRVQLDVTGRSNRRFVTMPNPVAVVSPPVSSPPRPPRPLAFTLSDGATLWVFPRRETPLVTIRTSFRAGASSHPPSLGGLARLTAACLTLGTQRRDPDTFAAAFESLGATVSAWAGWDGTHLGFSGLADYLDEGLDLLSDLLSAPSWPLREFSRVHAQTMTALRAAADSPDAVAHRHWLRLIYEVDHPYRVPLQGVEATVANLTRDDLRAFHQLRHRSSAAVWIVVGRLDPEWVRDRLDAWLVARPPGGEVPTPEVGDAVACPKSQLARTPWKSERPGRLVVVDRPGASQAVVKLGHPAPPRRHPDIWGLTVLNLILGGQFVSRLNTRLREEKGLTYSIESHFDHRREGGLFGITAALQADRLAEALGEIRRELIDLTSDRPPTTREAAEARAALIGQLPQRFETAAGLTSEFSSLFLHEQPLDEFDQLHDHVADLTADRLAELAQRWIDPQRLAVVVVADLNAIRNQLRALDGIDPVVLTQDDPTLI